MSDEAARMREMAAQKAEQLFNCGYVPGLDIEDITARDTGNQIAVAIRALPLPPASDKTAEALRLAREALEAAQPWVDSGPAGSWQAGVQAKIDRALAALSALTRPEGGE